MVLGIYLVALFMSTSVLAQVQDDSTQVNRPALIASPEDTSLVNQNNRPNPQSGFDSSTQTTQSQQSSRATVPDAVQFQSQDSLVVDFKNGRTASLYGAAKVSHPSGTLTSGTIDMDLKTNVVEATASNPQDTTSMPVLTRESDEIRSRRILFNYKTQKGKFEEARIKVGEGQLIGSKVKNVSETEVFIEDGIYSTCPPEYLYYYLKAEKMKVVDQDEIFFANAALHSGYSLPIGFSFWICSFWHRTKTIGFINPNLCV